MEPSVTEEMGTIAFIWEAYAQLIRRGNERNMEHKIQQRKALLDKFLDHFIHLSLKEKGGISFGEMRNIANELSQEFMRNVENVTRHVSEDDATQYLEDYMLRGRGWRLLYVVQQVGLKGVSQRQDLCQILISLLPYCAHMSPHGPSEAPSFSGDQASMSSSLSSTLSSNTPFREDLSANFYSSNASLSSCFQLVNKSIKLKTLGCPSLRSRRMPRVESGTSLIHLVSSGKKRSKSKEGKGRKKLTKTTPTKKLFPTSETDGDDPDDILGLSPGRLEFRRNKHPKFKRGLRSYLWAPVNKEEDSESDDDYLSQADTAEGPNIVVTGYHLIQIIIHLLQAIGELDISNNMIGPSVSATILPHLLFFLEQFREENKSGVSTKMSGSSTDTCAVSGDEFTESASDEESEPLPWSGIYRLNLLRQVVRAILTLSGIVATQQNGVRILSNLKVIEILLDNTILDSINPESMNQSSEVLGTQPLSQSNNLLLSVFRDMVCGSIQLLQVIYLNLPFNPSYINDANNLALKLFTPETVKRIKSLIHSCNFKTNVSEKRTSVHSDSRKSKTSFQEKEEVISSLHSEHGKEEDILGCLEGISELPSSVNLSDEKEKQDFEKLEKSSPRSASNGDNQSYVNDPGGADKNSVSLDTSRSYDSSKLFEDKPPIDNSSDPVRCLGTFITTLKSIKVNYIHAIKCLKRRHHNCGYGSYYDHHHDILGLPYYSSENIDINGLDTDSDSEYMSQKDDRGTSNKHKPTHSDQSSHMKCIISQLSNLLLDCVSMEGNKAGHVHLLSTIRSVGLCCCLQPDRVISSLVSQLPGLSPAVRSYALDTLTSILLDQLQGAQENQTETQTPKTPTGVNLNSKGWDKRDRAGSVKFGSVPGFSDSNRCVHCFLEGSSPLLAGLPTTMDSGFSSCDIEEMRRQRLLERWKSLRLLRKNITSSDESIALTCAKHLMTLAIRGNSEIKEELFFGVYLHILHMKVKVHEVSHHQGSVINQQTDTNLDDCVDENKEEESSKLDKNGQKEHVYEKDFQILNELSNSTEMSSSNVILSESETTVPGSVMLLCVSALPYVLQVDKVMSMFLSRGGLSKLTDLLEYNQLRSPVMSVFEALVMIDEKRLRGNPVNKKSLYEGGGVIQTFIDNLAKRTCNVTATLQLLSLHSPKESVSASPQGSPDDSSILDLYKKEPQNDSLPDGTSGGERCQTDARDSFHRTSAIIDDDPSLVASLPILLDMWRTCAKLCMNSRMFRAYYRESPCLYVVQETLVLALSLLGNLTDSSKCRTDIKEGGNCSEHLGPNGQNGAIDTDKEDASMLFCHQNKLEFIEAVMMVCFSSHTISPYQKRGEEDELWLRLNSALQSCIRLEHSKLSAVFQMLLNVALPRCPSVLEYSYSQIVSMLNLRDRENISDEDEVEHLLQQSYEEDVEVMNSERGYDADTECTVTFDWKKSLEDNLLESCMRNFSATRRPCFPAAFRLFVELMVACHKIASRGVILHTVALRLLQTLRSSERAVQAVCSENLLEIFMTGFQEVLVRCPTNGKFSTLQEIILSLIQVIAGSEISSLELRQFLKLCQDTTETTNSLLSTWLAAIEKHPVAPNTCAVFPVKTLMPLDVHLKREEELDELEILPGQLVWHHVAVELDVPAIEWPPYEKGFSLAMWISVDQCVSKHQNQRFETEIGATKDDADATCGSDKEGRNSNVYQLPMQECLLVVAIGNKEKMLEVWVHANTASLVFRLTSGHTEALVLKETTLYNFMKTSQWHLLNFSYIDSLDGSTFLGRLIVTLDGHIREEIILDHPASMGKKSSSLPFLCVGDARHRAAKLHTGTWKMGTLRIFKGVQLSPDFWFHLYCLGPNFGGLSLCDCGDTHVSYTPALRKHMVNVKHLNRDVLFGISQLPDLDIARASQVLVYRLTQPEMYSTFVSPRSSGTNSQDDLGLISQSGNNSKLLTHKPILSAAKVRGRIKIKERNTLEKAVEQCGGIEAFLFLVAKIFEDSMKTVKAGGSLSDAEELQSKATLVLFQLLHRFPSLAQSFEELNGYSMLAKVFTSSQSLVGYPLLKVLMNAATTESVFKSNPCSRYIPLIRTHPEGIIQDLQVITKLLLNWRVWNKADAHVSTLLFGALEALVSPSHPHRDFNLKQMHAGNMTNLIFNIYLERIQDGQPSLSVEVSKSASMIIKGLIGSPPDVHLLMAAMDFLLLVHPAPSGFINFAPGSFFFKMWWDGAKNRTFNSSLHRRKLVTKRSHSVPIKPHASHSQSSDEVTPARVSKLISEKSESPNFTSSYSLVESEDDVKGEFRYPPLKTASPSMEQSIDMDADLEESTEFNSHEHFNNMERDKFKKRMLSIRCDTPDMSSSGEHEGDSLKGKRKLLNPASRSISLPLPVGKISGSPITPKIYLGEDVLLENTETDYHKGSQDSTDASKGLVLELDESIDSRQNVTSPVNEDDVNGANDNPKIDSKDLQDHEESSLEENSEEDDCDPGLMTLCVCLLEYLTSILKEASTSLLDNVLNKVLSPKSMLVLAKNPSGDMRAAVMKLLGAYLCKATPSLVESFIKMDGFYLLANQLHHFPVVTKHIEIATSIFMQQDFVFNKKLMRTRHVICLLHQENSTDGLCIQSQIGRKGLSTAVLMQRAIVTNFTIGALKELSPMQQVAPVVLLSLLDGTASDPVLCKKSLVLVLQLLESNPTMSTTLLDLGLAEALCNLATNIQRHQHSKEEVTLEEEEVNRVLLVHVQHVLCHVAVSEFGWAGPSHYQQVEELFALLRSMEEHESLESDELSQKCADTARAFQISLVVRILEDVESRSEDLANSSQGWFTSSGSSLSQGRSSSSLSSRNPSTHHLLSKPSTYSLTSSLGHPSSTLTPGIDQSSVMDKLSAQSFLMRSSYSTPDMVDLITDHTQEEGPVHPVESTVSTPPSQTALRNSEKGTSGKTPSLFASIFSKQRRLIYTSPSQSELLDRFKKILVIATDLAVMFPRNEQLRPVEERSLPLLSEAKIHSLEDNYLRHLFDKIFYFYQNNVTKEFLTSKKRNPIMHGARDVLRVQFTRTLLCLISCKVDFELRAYTLAFVMTEPRATDAIKIIITDQQVGAELSFCLYNLLASWKDWLNMAQREFGFALMQLLRRAGFKIFSPDATLHQHEVDLLVEDKKQIDVKFRREYMMCAQKRETLMSRVSIRFDKVLRRVTEQAMLVTQNVTKLQNEERKKLIAHIKKAMTAEIQLKKQWHEIVQNLTHERAVWFYPDSYPQSWQLDPTEGPGRVRKRLQRSHLGIQSRFLLPEHQEKLNREKVDPPLIFLFEDDHQMSDSAALIYRLYTNEKIQHTCKCTAVSPANESRGELLVGEVCLYFVADGAITGANYTQLLLGHLDQLSITWPHTEIRELHKRWYQLQDVGLEIFLICGRTCLLAFQNTENRDELYSLLHNSLELPNLVSIESLQSVQSAWLAGDVTNYDYLMHLNKVSGRSYTDLMQYPVFPFVLRDYQSSTLNLADSKVYRNLKKPVAVQDKSKEKKYVDNYEFLKQDAFRPPSEEDMMRVAPFHYGSHYSNSGTVLHYMVRLPPFTRMFLSYQDSNFDIPDRTFHSLGTSWRLSSYDSSTDVKELIPEFYFLPEFFINNEGFAFGLRQNGQQVNDVSLPPWCEGNPRLFVLIHRQALESDYVRALLHHWLDLVFGYKQQGEEAIKAINVFHPSTYFGVDASKIKEPLKRQALLTMIRTYGQTPKQLFRSPHAAVPASTIVEEPRKPFVPRPVPTVVGLKWGSYLGSPDQGPPVYTDLDQSRPLSVSKLIALPGGLIFGVEKNASILLLHGKRKDMAMQITEVMWAGVVTWDYHDSIIRIHSNADRPVINFMAHHGSGKITCVESLPDCRILFTAGTAGIINAYTMTHNSSKQSCLQVRGVKKTLYGHSGPITSLVVCHAFSILVSGSADGTCIIWDLNKLTYVTSITSHSSDVHAIAISETLGDIASASCSGENCILQLHSINATPIASQTVYNNTILCLAYSNAPEGKSVNVIAGGLKSGIIRLWSSWNLCPLRDLTKEPPLLRPIVSLTYSSDSQYLMSVGIDGVVTLWAKDTKALRTNSKNFQIISSHDSIKR